MLPYYIHHLDPRLLPAHGSPTPRPRSLSGSLHIQLDSESKDRVWRVAGEISGPTLETSDITPALGSLAVPDHRG